MHHRGMIGIASLLVMLPVGGCGAGAQQPYTPPSEGTPPDPDPVSHQSSPQSQGTPQNSACDDCIANRGQVPATTTSPARTDSGAMVWIPGGIFPMGSNHGRSDERPVQRVSLNGFYIDRTEVTVAAYEACMDAEVCTLPKSGGYCNLGKPDRANHPINCVDFDQAVAYCTWAEKRLPTEEEWEYAAHGRDESPYPWGSAAPGSQLCWRSIRGRGTCHVASFPGGAFGLADMAGNVWEWTASHYSQDYSSGRTFTERVVRGGGWADTDPSTVRATVRHKTSPTDRSPDLGFRCVK